MAMGNSAQAAKVQFKPRKSAKETLPDAPEGEWEFLIPKGLCKVTKTKNEDPQVLIPHKLVKAAEEDNEPFQGSVVPQRIIFFDDADPEKRKGANFHKGTLRALCEAVDVEYDDVYPEEINDSSDFDDLLQALEGKTGTCWTVHNTRDMGNGEMITNTEIRYRKPGAGLVTKGSDSDDEDRPAAKKPAKKTGRR